MSLKQLHNTHRALESLNDKLSTIRLQLDKQIQDKNQSIASLTNHREQYKHLIQEKATSGVGAAELQRLDSFVMQLEQVIQMEKQALEQLKLRQVQAIEQEKRAESKKMGVATIACEVAKDIEKRANKNEQTDIDDLATHG